MTDKEKLITAFSAIGVDWYEGCPRGSYPFDTYDEIYTYSRDCYHIFYFNKDGSFFTDEIVPE